MLFFLLYEFSKIFKIDKSNKTDMVTHPKFQPQKLTNRVVNLRTKSSVEQCLTMLKSSDI